MKKTTYLLAIFLGLLSAKIFAQETFYLNGIEDNRKNIIYAYTNATIFQDANTSLKNATMLVQNGRILACGTNTNIPKGAVIVNLNGKYIYPSFIDLYSDYGLKSAPPKRRERGNSQRESSEKTTFGWNEALKPYFNASQELSLEPKKAEKLRKIGFGVVLTHQKDGIARGTSALVTTGNQKEIEEIIAKDLTNHFSFSKGSSSQDYPGSLMGSIALIEQTNYDADWYQKNIGKTSQTNLMLEAWNRNLKLPAIFETSNKADIKRADLLGDKFNIQYIIKTEGDEYQNLEEVKSTNAKLIVPVNFPAVFEIEDQWDILNLSLADLKHWEMAPANLKMLSENGITFAITAADLKNQDDFLKNLQKAVKYGLSSRLALKALTEIPAQIINQSNQLGALKPGFMANFLISNDTLFAENFIITQHHIQGIPYEIKPDANFDLRGDYDFVMANKTYGFEIKGESPEKMDVSIRIEKIAKKIKFIQNENTVSFHFEIDGKLMTGSGFIAENGKKISGTAQNMQGELVNWVIVKKADASPNLPAKIDSTVYEIGPMLYPLNTFGWKEKPKAKNYLIKNATIWTLEKEGILEETDILIQNGKISQIGKNLTASNAEIIDAKGKHVSPGIIDEHSHIAISRGVNEWGKATSAEVSIQNVIDAEDINIYRQLAGGVTAAQLLHGSSNPIGGQSAIIKLKWGFNAEDLKIKEAKPFIKFALGENVKQGNSPNSNRYPQTRMGVEQYYYDHFQRAIEYKNTWANYSKLSSKEKLNKPSPRKEMYLDVLNEILESKRFITCHSYIQSEINMLMFVADSFNFKINTFTHILEGYKVADKMKKHGVGASTFSDWWAYKFEVNDAIPFNASLLNQMQIVTAINSDDADMGRRLNQEAAKAIKYGGMSEEDALKMVTLNPAKLLQLDDKIGSLKVGKDADLVIWSHNPLTVYAQVEKTFIEGICFFDRSLDQQKLAEAEKEKMRIIQKMLKNKKTGEPSRKVEKKEEKHYHCDTEEEGAIY